MNPDKSGSNSDTNSVVMGQADIISKYKILSNKGTDDSLPIFIPLTKESPTFTRMNSSSNKVTWADDRTQSEYQMEMRLPERPPSLNMLKSDCYETEFLQRENDCLKKTLVTMEDDENKLQQRLDREKKSFQVVLASKKRQAMELVTKIKLAKMNIERLTSVMEGQVDQVTQMRKTLEEERSKFSQFRKAISKLTCDIEDEIALRKSQGDQKNITCSLGNLEIELVLPLYFKRMLLLPRYRVFYTRIITTFIQFFKVFLGSMTTVCLFLLLLYFNNLIYIQCDSDSGAEGVEGAEPPPEEEAPEPPEPEEPDTELYSPYDISPKYIRPLLPR